MNIKEPSHLGNEWMGIAICAVFCSEQKFDNSVNCFLIANGIHSFLVAGYAHIFFYQIIFGYFTCFLNISKRNTKNYCGNVMRMDSVILEFVLKPGAWR